MQLWPLAVLLILQCCIPLAVGDDSRSINIDSLASVGTTNFKGTTLRVFEIDGAQLAEPIVSFGSSCNSLRYNHLYLKYQLTLPISIDVNTLEKPTDSSKKVAKVTLTGLLMKADIALASSDAKVTVIARVTKADKGEAQLIILCDTFIRCQQLKDDVHSNPEEFLLALEFTPVGKLYGVTVKLGSVRSVSPPNFSCSPDRWVVFQRRVDGSLSFAQNWDAYVKGFGNPESNYWMGLNKLFAMTVTNRQSSYANTSRCQLRIETEDFNGKQYWAEYKQFEVLDPEQNYRLRVGQEVSGSMGSFGFHNQMQFSTYDRDHDAHPDSCSQAFGYGGWWYAACHSVNLNGAYTTDRSIVNHPAYNTLYAGSYVPMKYTLMKFKCH